MVTITKTAYTGYLKPWLSEINKLWDQGQTQKQIAAVICKKIEKSKEFKASYYYKQWGLPRLSSSMIHYVLERTRGPLEKRSNPYDYPTAERWRSLLPSKVAHDQARWERLREMHNMLKLGFTLNKIALRMGISRVRVRQLTLRPLSRSPLEVYLDENNLFALSKSEKLRNWATGGNNENHTSNGADHA